MSTSSTAGSPSQARTSFVILIASAAAMGGFLFGFDTAVINGAVLAVKNTFQVGDWMIGIAVSLALLGSAIGAFAAGPIADHIGRTKSMLIASVMFFLSAIGSGAPFGIWDFIAWRTLGGIAVGIASVIAPAYIAEVSPASLRGRLGSLQQLAIVVGIFVALLMNYAIALGAGGSAESPFWFGIPAWRWMFWAEAPPAILYGIGALLVPESPRYLVAVSKHAEAENVLSKIMGIAAAKLKVSEIRRSVVSESKPRMRDVLSPKLGLLPIVWVGIALSAFQQFVGINVIFYYSSVLWRAVGFTEDSALWVTMITGLTNIVTTIVAIMFVDRIGRKPLLLVGSIGMAITLATMAYFFGTAPIVDGVPRLDGTPALIALVVANLYVFCFGFSWGPVVWVLLGEMFNNKIRGAALAVAASAQWVANFIVSTTFPPMSSSLGLGISYGIYAAFAAVSFFFVMIFIKETKGRELESM